MINNASSKSSEKPGKQFNKNINNHTLLLIIINNYFLCNENIDFFFFQCLLTFTVFKQWKHVEHSGKYSSD